MQISLIIPTKNRRKELIKLLDSILFQTRKPKEVFVIDQSSSCGLTKNEINRYKNELNLNYIYDPGIKGLVEAKMLGVRLSVCEIISFLDDDLSLEENYFEEIGKGFQDCSNMYG